MRYVMEVVFSDATSVERVSGDIYRSYRSFCWRIQRLFEDGVSAPDVEWLCASPAYDHWLSRRIYLMSGWVERPA